MSQDPSNLDPQASNDPINLAEENAVLKLKMMAEFGADFGPTAQEVTPELENQFLKQVYAFEKNYAGGNGKTFGESLGQPPFPVFADLAKDSLPDLENLVDEVIDHYQAKNVAVSFQYEYPAELRYRFLVEELPNCTNHFGEEPEMMVGVVYEEYHPNHAGDIETCTEDFLDALSNRDIEAIQVSLAPIQLLPEGPYPAHVLIDAMAERFEKVDHLENFEYTVLEVSYDFSEADDEAEDPIGMGYSEGLIKFTVNDKDGATKEIGGPFKLYFHFEFGAWSIIYIVMPGIKYPAQPKVG